MMEKIVSKDNAKIKEYAKLVSSKRERDKTGLFVIEGVKLFGEALRCGVEVVRVFVTQGCLDAHPGLEEKLKAAQSAFLIPEGLQGKLAQSPSPEGLYAVCRQLDKPGNLAKIDCNGSYVGLWDLQDPGNVGTIIRAADAMGLSGVLLSENCCDLYSLKTLRAAMGSVFRLPVFRVNMSDFLAGTPLVSYAAVLDPTATPVTGVSFKGSIALIGNEGNGLSEEQILSCTGTVTIPMKGRAESLNAAMAAVILMWEMARGS